MTTQLTLSQTFATNALQVQQLEKQDIALALDLIAAIKTSGVLQQPHHLKDRTESELHQLMNDGYPLFGIKDFDGKLISFATVSKVEDDANEVIIRSLCTSPHHKGYGCGAKIIQAAMDWVNENGTPDLYAKVAADNQASLSLFKKAGFNVPDLQWDETYGYGYYMVGKTNGPMAASVAVATPAHYKTPEYI